MYELFKIGIEMQQRMIDAHEQGIKATRDLLDAAKKQTDVASALSKAGKSQAEMLDGWMRLWSGRG